MPTLKPLYLALLLAATPVAAQQNTNKVSDDIKVQAGQTVGNLKTISGDIELKAGAQAGRASTVSGDIDLESGAKAGALTTVSGDIDGGDFAQLGDLATVSGDIKLGQDARTGAAKSTSGDIHYGRNAVLKQAETVSGEIFIAQGGAVAGDIKTISGSIGLIGTRLDGSVTTYVGDVTIGIGSHVKGGLTVRKPERGNSALGFNNNNRVTINGPQRIPRIIIGPDAVIEGALVFEHEVKLYVHASAKTGAISGATAQRFDTPTAPRD